MELQLGLALPTTTSLTSKNLDLNNYNVEFKDQQWLSRGSVNEFSTKKRSFGDAFDEENDPQTLPLLRWNNQPPNDEDDPQDHKNCTLGLIEVEEEDDVIVGWPPIKFRRKRLCYRNRHNRRVDNGCADCHGRPSNSMYVKVKMEGVGIARKIDLSRFGSFEMLKATLLDMFEIFEDYASNYKLTYQDREGDWLVAEDICWRSFILSVQRLRLIRRSG